MSGPLKNRVAVVAGATRGAGRGIAVELGAAGAVVYCTGRSVRGRPSDMGRPETIEETAELVSAAGGVGIPVRVDHTLEDEVKTLFERVGEEQGQLDVLVNDLTRDYFTRWKTPFWEFNLEHGRHMLNAAVAAHLLNSYYAAPLMVEQNRGLIIEVTDGDGLHYRGNLFYDFCKVGNIRLAYAMAEDFKRFNKAITAVALTPGFLRSEAVLDDLGVREANWQDGAKQDPYFAGSETPHYIGRAVVALASDENVHEKAGQALSTWGLSEEYGFKDVDGRQPHWQNFFDETKGAEAG